MRASHGIEHLREAAFTAAYLPQIPPTLPILASLRASAFLQRLPSPSRKGELASTDTHRTGPSPPHLRFTSYRWVAVAVQKRTKGNVRLRIWQAYSLAGT